MRGMISLGGSRQDQVLEQLMAGKSEKEIAGILGLSTHTIHTYVKMLLREYGATSRPELMAKCFRATIATLGTTHHGLELTNQPRFVG